MLTIEISACYTDMRVKISRNVLVSAHSMQLQQDSIIYTYILAYVCVPISHLII